MEEKTGDAEMTHHMEHETRQGIPLLGEKVPEMEVQTTHGRMKIPNDLSGKWFILFSHPGDFTPVCTTEFIAFEKMRKEFDDLNCALVGLSMDQVHSHMKWTEWIKEMMNVEITFPIIADNGTVAGKLGMVHPGKGTNTVRAVFVVDPKGVIRLMLYYPQEIGRNMDEILRAVKALQISDKNKVAMPANWPNNDLFGDEVIIPPPSDEKTAATRKTGGGVVCEDWWFCHKKL
ncbi:peroxiredoxin [Methanotrichaceae archaeon M04Ac]|uniref:Peroxiredoxin n=2 Tax=Candidatus Methanocrinis alkalitolerans TaxID=3033395 RepID=A0ABT5XDS6_9EURY|nr:peroxiredoxin [Candidatus Methanocrinis alkalitolerans]MCR3884171.1 peroxiredoxin [Methanothrix sp.]MDF0592859.1 peroxiredoxin [Candidatus Methanocrinis alkalitolerans]